MRQTSSASAKETTPGSRCSGPPEHGTGGNFDAFQRVFRECYGESGVFANVIDTLQPFPLHRPERPARPAPKQTTAQTNNPPEDQSGYYTRGRAAGAASSSSSSASDMSALSAAPPPAPVPAPAPATEPPQSPYNGSDGDEVLSIMSPKPFTMIFSLDT